MPAGDPLVVETMLDYRATLLVEEGQQMGQMARQWLGVQDALESKVSALANRIGQLQAAGESISESRLLELSHYRSLLAQAQTEINRYAGGAEGLITEQQLAWGQLGAESAQAAIGASYTSAGVAVASFNVLPVAAIEQLAGFAANGSPLAELLAGAWPEASARLTQELLDAIALGLNPRETARLMMEGLDSGLDRMLLIARTEQLRAFRESNRMQMQHSGVCSGYKRLCARQPRTCLACLLADGDRYELDEPFEEHPAGRCTLVPEVSGLPVIEWEDGTQWLLGQDNGLQQQIMGAGRYDAWQDGLIDLDQMVERRTSDVWGNSLQVAPLRDLIGG